MSSPTLLVKRLLKRFFQVFGLDVSFSRPAAPVDPMMEGLQRLAKLGIKFNTIVDVGAAIGSWSLASRELWPNAQYLLVEPLAERKQELEALVKRTPGFHYAPVIAGKEKGEMDFFVSDDLWGSGVAANIETGKSDSRYRKTQVNSIDNELRERNLNGPYLIKLDTHGFELPILEGCVRVLPETNAFIIECYGFQIANGSLLFWEMCQHMDRLGFRTFDIVDILRRASDNAFWQFDIFFIRKDHTVFSHSLYH